ncbi:hypothetical protein D3C78_1610530 [compost metagenome]
MTENRFLARLAMAAQVHSADTVALVAQCLGQAGVAAAVFGHAMGQHDHRQRGGFRQPLVDEQAAMVGRGQPERLVDHGDSFCAASLHCIAHPLRLA